MKITYNPENKCNSDIVKRNREEIKRCQVCPNCKNKDEFYKYKIDQVHTKFLIPDYYIIKFTNPKEKKTYSNG